MTYEVGAECFTLLFRTPIRGGEAPCSCFAIYGEQFHERICEQVLEWTLSRSGTIDDGVRVAEEVRLVRETLAANGPLAATSRMPDGAGPQTGRRMRVADDAERSSPSR